MEKEGVMDHGETLSFCGGRFISGLGNMSWLLAKPEPAVGKPKAYRAAKALRAGQAMRIPAASGTSIGHNLIMCPICCP
jgi:hypothetical protein